MFSGLAVRVDRELAEGSLADAEDPEASGLRGAGIPDTRRDKPHRDAWAPWRRHHQYGTQHAHQRWHADGDEVQSHNDLQLPLLQYRANSEVAEFVDREVRPVARDLEHADTCTDTLIEQMKQLGVFGLAIPEP